MVELRPIKTEADYDAALAAVDRLMDKEPELGTPESDQLEMLVTLIQAYEAKHYPMPAPDPIEAIKFRMEQGALTRRDLEPAIGGDGRVSEVLNRKRPLSLTMIRKLNAMFGIPVDSLIGEYETAE
jgi:HTH-type transcriptional regulator/antitoxin HigA